MPTVVIAPPGPPISLPPLPPPSRPKRPRDVANIQARIIVRLDRNIDARNSAPSRRGGIDVQALQQSLLQAAGGDYQRLVPSGLDKSVQAGWRFSVEPAFPGASLKDPYRLWSYFIVTVPAIRGSEIGWMWDLAHSLVRRTKQLELAFPESFGGQFKLSSGGAGAQAPGDMAWSLRQMRVEKARAFAGSLARPAGGEDIVVGHLDTGWSRHPQLETGAVDVARQHNTLSVPVFPPRVESANDAIDPYTGVLDIFHSHGLATASVLVSRGKIFDVDFGSTLNGQVWLGAPLKSGTGTEQDGAKLFATGAGTNELPGNAEVVGVAPGAKLLPVRCSDTVILTGDIEIAQAVWYACQQNVDVITMSLGGVPSPLLHVALAHAVNARNIIFCAAAGNAVPFVVFPAAYPEAIACAGSRPDGHPWTFPGSSFGPQVDISAPAQDVWVAHMKMVGGNEVPIVNPGQGTSFATPAVAGAAAVWLAFHGRPALRARYPGVPLQDVFRTLLKRTAYSPPPGFAWPPDFGAGVVDLEALLKAPLPPEADVQRTDPWSPDAFLGYLADGAAIAAAAVGASRLPSGTVGAMALLELGQFLISRSDFGKVVQDMANDVQQSVDQVVDDIVQSIENAANSVSEFFRKLFGG